MPKHKFYKRTPKRKKQEVVADIVRTKKVVREDVYDLIKDTESRQQAEDRIRETFRDVAEVHYLGDHEKGIERIVSDLASYGVEWEK